MKHYLRNVAAGSAAVMLLIGASAGAANAYYLGYGNGDPGNWSFWDEQNGGPVHKSKQGHMHHTALHHNYASKNQKQS
jgi:hypothetical protein